MRCSERRRVVAVAAGALGNDDYIFQDIPIAKDNVGWLAVLIGQGKPKVLTPVHQTDKGALAADHCREVDVLTSAGPARGLSKC